MIGHKIIHLDTVDSTNNYTAKLVRTGQIQSGAVILTDEQVAGRGQRGNTWETDAGTNLISSCYIEHDNLSVDHQFRLSQWVSLAICKVLERMHVSAKIKWPNDIYVGDKKIAGILIENSLGSKGVNSSIIGVGLNVNQVEFNVNRATSIKLETGNHNLLDAILYAYINALNEFHVLLHQPEELKKRYLKNLYRNKERHAFLVADTQVLGKILTVQDNGRLVVEFDLGQIQDFDIQEISFVFD